MNKDKRKQLIKSLLSDRLTKSRRKDFADLPAVDKEIKDQWSECGNRNVDVRIKEQIWEKVQAKCDHKKSSKVLVELSRKKD